jgi:hypothetical protein
VNIGRAYRTLDMADSKEAKVIEKSKGGYQLKYAVGTRSTLDTVIFLYIILFK